MAKAFGTTLPIEGYADENGRFAVYELPAGTFDVEVSAPGFAPTSVASVEILADSAETDLGEITLEPGAAIEGRVTDRRGSAIEGAQVFAAEAATQAAFFMAARADETEPAAVSDVNGFFTVAERRAGEKVDLTVRKTGYARASVPGVEAPTHRPVAVQLLRASRVRGEVVDADGRSVSGAQVWLEVQISTVGMGMSQHSGRATTDEDGLFVIDEVDPGEIELHVMAEGYRNAELKSLIVEPERDLDNLRIVIEPGATISGRVTDASGRPVADAMVAITEQGMRYSGFSNADVSDAEGRYRLHGVTPGRRSITAQHESFPPTSRELEIELGDNVLDLTFEAGATLSGRVVDEAGQPVAGAEVTLSSSSALAWQGQTGVSDTTGGFAISGVPAGTYSLQASKEGFATGVVQELEVGASDLQGLEIRLATGSAIVGQLLGLERFEFPTVQVMAFSPPSSSSMGRVDEDGRYRIDDLAPGEYHVNAQVGRTARGAHGTVTVVEGAAETTLDLEFKTGLTITGVVLRGGEPMIGASVSAFGLDLLSSSGGSTDSEGRFQLLGLEPGRHVVTVGDYATGLGHREEIDLTGDLDIVIQVEAARVSGSVRDATDSTPLAGATVQLEALEPQASPWGLPMNPSTTTDSAGFFRFAQASAGSYRLLAHREGYAPSETTLTVVDGLDQEGLELLLEPTEGTRVFVTLPTGQPAIEFFAAVIDAAGRSLMSGVYHGSAEGAVLSFPPGNWELLVSARNSAVSSTRVSVPGDPVVIALREPALLTVRVPELEGDPTLAVTKITGADGRAFRSLQWVLNREEWPLSDGRTTIMDLEPGTWLVTVEATDGRVWQGQATLAPGDNPELFLQ